jgi:hypothetical protein
MGAGYVPYDNCLRESYFAFFAFFVVKFLPGFISI